MKKSNQKSTRDIANFIGEVNAAALQNLESLCAEILSGHKSGHQFVALNPTRADKNLGSFKINLHNGMWSDFATKDSGGDPVSLYAYLFGLRQFAAAKELGQKVGVMA